MDLFTNNVFCKDIIYSLYLHYFHSNLEVEVGSDPHNLSLTGKTPRNMQFMVTT